MIEEPPPNEGQNERMAGHNQFLTDRRTAVMKNVGRVLGLGTLAAGSVFALDSIGQFVTGIPPSSILAHTDSTMVPSIIKTAGEHLMAMNLTIKAGGGASIMHLGRLILNRVH